MARWPGGQMARWPGGQEAIWPGCQWPVCQVARWPDGQVARVSVASLPGGLDNCWICPPHIFVGRARLLVEGVDLQGHRELLHVEGVGGHLGRGGGQERGWE